MLVGILFPLVLGLICMIIIGSPIVTIFVAVHGVRGSVYTTAGTAEKETP
jgi:hypothetical protein